MFKKIFIILFVITTLLFSGLASCGIPLLPVGLFFSKEPDPDAIDGLVVIKLEDIAPIDLEMKMGGHILRVPINRMKSWLNYDDYDKTQATGFSLVTLWPDFPVKTYDRLPEFRSMRNGKVISIHVSPACDPDLLANPPAIPCTPKRSMKTLYDIYGIDKSKFIPASDLPDVTATPMPGMKLVGFLDSQRDGDIVPEYDGKDLNRDSNVYMNIDDRGYIEFTECLRRKSGYSCKHWFNWRDAFDTEIIFQIQHIPNWQTIRKKVVDILENMVVEPQDTPSVNGHEVIRFPMTHRESRKLYDQLKEYYRNSFKNKG